MTEAAAATPDATNRTDILVAGAGSTGLAAALAFAKSGMRVMLVGRIPPPSRSARRARPRSRTGLPD